MKEIVIISGKGGTGKTTITASFAVLARNKVMADCDVDAADLHLMLHPEIKKRFEFKGMSKAFINQEKCTGCGACERVCRFDAIVNTGTNFYVNQLSCEGCRVCMSVCPVGAIELEDDSNGEWYISETKYGPMVHAKLGIAEENSGKLVSIVRQQAKNIAEENGADYIIVDGPPGIGCPVISSLTGVDLALIVTEPTLSGIHDMKRIVEVANRFSVPVKVIINKYNINLENSDAIEKFSEMNQIQVLGRLPFSENVIESITKGIPVVEFCKDEVSEEIINIWGRVVESLK